MICKFVRVSLICGIKLGWAETNVSADARLPGASSVGLQIGCFCFDFDYHGHLCAWPNKQATQMGQCPFQATNCLGITPFSANTINFGNGMWCSLWWWLLSISSCKSDRLFGVRTWCRSSGQILVHSQQYSSEVCGMDAISGFSMKFSISGSKRMIVSFESLILHFWFACQ